MNSQRLRVIRGGKSPRPPPRRPKRIPGTRLVPKDLFDGHPLWPVRFRRLTVAGFVLMAPDQWWDRAWHVEVTKVWGDRLSRPGHVSVLSALIELEQLGVCSNIQEHDPHLFSVEVG